MRKVVQLFPVLVAYILSIIFPIAAAESIEIATTTIHGLPETATAIAMTTSPPYGAANTTSQGSRDPGYRVGVGLVEIAALATLIGATSAEALALGMRGPGGLPWACTSSFGLIHVIRVSIAASLPVFLRELLGLRSAQVDAALGINVPLKTPSDQRRATNRIFKNVTDKMGVICGLWVKRRADPTHVKIRNEERTETGAQQSRPATFYGSCSWDASVSSLLIAAPTLAPTNKMDLHEYVSSIGALETRVGWLWQDLGILLTSMLKLAETLVLYRSGGKSLWWLSSLGWCQGFILGIIIWVWQFSREKSQVREEIDLVAGELPTALHHGGTGKILIGAPTNGRDHWLWTCVWALSAAFNTAILIVSFLTLGSGSIPSNVVQIWMGFQILWLFCRIFVYTFADKGPDPGVVATHSWQMAPRRLKKRAVRLMFGLAQRIVMEHPRGWYSYGEDKLDPQEIAVLLQDTKPEFKEKLPRDMVGEFCDVIAVIGDPVLRTFLWLNGTPARQEVYDSVFVLVQLQGKKFAVPAVRVLSGIPTRISRWASIFPSLSDEEMMNGGSFDPRGTTNTGSNISWFYWIPVEGHGGDASGWLEVQGMNILGNTKSAFLEESALESKLASGTLMIGMSSVRELKDVLKVSHEGVRALYDILEDADLYVN